MKIHELRVIYCSRISSIKYLYTEFSLRLSLYDSDFQTFNSSELFHVISVVDKGNTNSPTEE